MAAEITAVMHKFDRETLCLKFPDTFDFLKGADAKYEMVTTNLLQPMTIFFSENVIAQRIAVVFVTTECNGMKPRNARMNATWKYGED